MTILSIKTLFKILSPKSKKPSKQSKPSRRLDQIYYNGMFGWVQMFSHTKSRIWILMVQKLDSIFMYLHIIYVPSLYPRPPPPGSLLHPPVQGAEQGVPASCFLCPPPPPDTGSNSPSHAGVLGTVQVQLNSRRYVQCIRYLQIYVKITNVQQWATTWITLWR